MLQQLQTQCVDRLMQRFRSMLEHIDDVFFDLADNAASDQHQNEYFHAMHELRLYRGDIERGFRSELQQAFVAPEKNRNAGADWVAEDELRLATDELASRLRNRHPAALMQVEARFRAIMPDVQNMAELPLAPEKICQCFLGSLQPLNIAPNPQLVMLKHFEKEVVPEFSSLLKIAMDTLHSTRGFDTHPPMPEKTLPPANRAPAGTDSFMLRLDVLQRQLMEMDADTTMENQGNWRHEIRQSAQSARQENTINAVFMLFEYLLERQDLPRSQAATFARLQIPIIRMALQDHQFIRDATHPARRLLKTLANAALRRKRNNQPDTRLQIALQHAAQAILQLDNAPDEGQCRQIENDFLTQIGGNEPAPKNRLSEHGRHRDAAPFDSGLAKPLVDQWLQHRLQGKTVPETFVAFIGGPWSNWLYVCREMHGNASSTWQEALQMTDELIWSVLPHRDEESHQRWMKRLPTLVKNVTDALGQILSPAERDAAIESLWVIHAALLRSDPQLRFVTLDFAGSEPSSPIP